MRPLELAGTAVAPALSLSSCQRGPDGCTALTPASLAQEEGPGLIALLLEEGWGLMAGEELQGE